MSWAAKRRQDGRTHLHILAENVAHQKHREQARVPKVSCKVLPHISVSARDTFGPQNVSPVQAYAGTISHLVQVLLGLPPNDAVVPVRAPVGIPRGRCDACTRTRQERKPGMVSAAHFCIPSGSAKDQIHESERPLQRCCLLLKGNPLLREFL